MIRNNGVAKRLIKRRHLGRGYAQKEGSGIVS